MMVNKNDGGPAFPRPTSTDEHGQPCNIYQDQTGMSLRDWFAGTINLDAFPFMDLKIAAEYLGVDYPDLTTSGPRLELTIKVIAKLRYEIADAMLEQRKLIDENKI